MRAERNSRNSRLFKENSIAKEPVKKPAPSLEKNREVIPYFVNAMGRPLESLGDNALELALRLGNVVDWEFEECLPDLDLSSNDVFELACRVGEGIVNKYPGATVLCQSDWGFTIALASYLAAHGAHPVYAKQFSYDSPYYKERELESYVEYKFPKIGRGKKFRKYSPDHVLLNLTNHPKEKWFDRSMFLGYGFRRTINAGSSSILSTENADEDRATYEAFAYYIAQNADASDAVVTGEWSYVAAVVPILIEAGICPLYPIMYYNDRYYPDGRPIKAFYKYRQYRIYRG